MKNRNLLPAYKLINETVRTTIVHCTSCAVRISNRLPSSSVPIIDPYSIHMRRKFEQTNKRYPRLVVLKRSRCFSEGDEKDTSPNPSKFDGAGEKLRPNGWSLGCIDHPRWICNSISWVIPKLRVAGRVFAVNGTVSIRN